jgi:hypothetical protein
LCDTSDVELTIRQLVHFMAAGLRAPVLASGEADVPISTEGPNE